MKKIILSIFFCCSLLAVFMTGCGSMTNTDIQNDSSVKVINKSEETKNYEEESVTQSKGKTMLKEENFDKVIQALSNRKEQVFPECQVENKLDSMDFQGSKVYSLTHEGYENVILYIHGGAWTFEKNKYQVSFCDELATKLNAKVYMPLYPIAPESNSVETYAFIESLYKEIIKENKPIYIMGDSAGGNIALGLMYTIKAENLQKPEKMVLIAPCSDMTFSNKELDKLNETDPMLELYGLRKCAEMWAGQENLSNPKYSAIYADVTDYPDTMIIQGTNDILYPDNLILYQNMKDAGVNVTLVKGEELWHCFPLEPIAEKEETLDLIEEFCSE